MAFFLPSTYVLSTGISSWVKSKRFSRTRQVEEWVRATENGKKWTQFMYIWLGDETHSSQMVHALSTCLFTWYCSVPFRFTLTLQIIAHSMKNPLFSIETSKYIKTQVTVREKKHAFWQRALQTYQMRHRVSNTG